MRALRAAGLETDARVVATEPDLEAALPAFVPDVVLVRLGAARLLG